MSDLTAERLRELLEYDPATGRFTLRVGRSGTAAAGTEAGSVGSDGYVRARVDGRRYCAHRLAWLHIHGRWPALHIDHINGDPTDNRLANLREATRSQNNANSRLRSDNVSGLKGASFDKRKGRWRAMIQHGGRNRHLGYFSTAEQAHAAYDAAARVLHGAFARAA